MDGYKIIDFKGIPIESSGPYEIIPGAFEAIKTANKPMVISNLVIKGDRDRHLKPFFTNLVTGDDEIGYATVLTTDNGNFTLLVETEDHVSVIPIT